MTHKVQIDHVVRDATKEETMIIDAQRTEAAALADAQAARASERQAVLDRLGITADEAKLLLGA
jgi:hypothetical protein